MNVQELSDIAATGEDEFVLNSYKRRTLRTREEGVVMDYTPSGMFDDIDEDDE